MLRLNRSSALQLLLLLLIAIAAVVMFYRLGDPALKNWDESIYAEVAKGNTAKPRLADTALATRALV